MPNIRTIPTDEMVDDYYASLMDAKTAEKLLTVGGFVDTGLAYRVDKNKQIMEVIEAELERRGELNRIGKGGENDS